MNLILLPVSGQNYQLAYAKYKWSSESICLLHDDQFGATPNLITSGAVWAWVYV